MARTLKPYVKDPKTGADPLAAPVAYPGGENGEGTNGFAENLRYLAALLTLPLGIRVATVDAAGRLRHPRRPGARRSCATSPSSRRA